MLDIERRSGPAKFLKFPPGWLLSPRCILLLRGFCYVLCNMREMLAWGDFRVYEKFRVCYILSVGDFERASIDCSVVFSYLAAVPNSSSMPSSLLNLSFRMMRS